MAPGAHLLISWLTTVEFLKGRRERAIVTLTGLAPDLDGAGLIIDFFTGTTNYYFKYHHYLGHSIFFAIFIASLAALIAKTQRLLVWFMSLVVIHLHFFCDLIGSRGPDGYQWPVYYLYPVSSATGLTWAGQWALNAWQNQLIFIILFICCSYYLVIRKVTFLEVFGSRLDKAAIDMYERMLKNKDK